VLAFGATYEAEMGKLPGEASELTRQARHRELLGLDDVVIEEPSLREPVDVTAIIAERKRG
jgi:hypothetical protein